MDIKLSYKPELDDIIVMFHLMYGDHKCSEDNA